MLQEIIGTLPWYHKDTTRRMDRSSTDTDLAACDAKITDGHNSPQHGVVPGNTNPIHTTSGDITGAMNSQKPVVSVCETKEFGAQEVIDKKDFFDVVQVTDDVVADSYYPVASKTVQRVSDRQCGEFQKGNDTSQRASDEHQGKSHGVAGSDSNTGDILPKLADCVSDCGRASLKTMDKYQVLTEKSPDAIRSENPDGINTDDYSSDKLPDEERKNVNMVRISETNWRKADGTVNGKHEVLHRDVHTLRDTHQRTVQESTHSDTHGDSLETTGSGNDSHQEVVRGHKDTAHHTEQYSHGAVDTANHEYQNRSEKTRSDDLQTVNNPSKEEYPSLLQATATNSDRFQRAKTEKMSIHDEHDDDLQTDSPDADTVLGHGLKCAGHHGEMNARLAFGGGTTQKHFLDEHQTILQKNYHQTGAVETHTNPIDAHQKFPPRDAGYLLEEIDEGSEALDSEQDLTMDSCEDMDDGAIVRTGASHLQRMQYFPDSESLHHPLLPASHGAATTLQAMQVAAALQNMAMDSEPSHLPANSNVTIEAETDVYVKTNDMDEAKDLIEDMGRVVLCGPPGCGKTTLAHALLRSSRRQGFTPYVFTEVNEWHKHIVEGKKCIVLMDALFGTVCVSQTEYKCWKNILSTILKLTRAQSCRLVITVYPHILKELHRLDSGTDSPFVDGLRIVRLSKKGLEKDEKKKILDFHLKVLNLDRDIQSGLVERILQIDASGQVFPWCCREMARNYDSSKDNSHIFTTPAEAYVSLLQQLTGDRKQGPVFAAVVALVMKKQGQFLLNPHSFQPHLAELGFSNFSADELETRAYYLKGSVVDESGTTFVSRVLYDAAGLSLARSSRLVTSVRVCDLKFLVEYVRTKDEDKEDVPPNSVLVQFDGQQALVKRIYEEAVNNKNLSVVSQHQSLQCPLFLDTLKGFCEPQPTSVSRQSKADQPSLRELLRADDGEHHLPLLYWSTLNPSSTLTQWCLTVTKDKRRFRPYLPQVLLALALLHQRSDPYQKVSSLIKDMDISLASIFKFPTNSALLPLPKAQDRVEKKVAEMIQVLNDYASGERHLCYLNNPSLPIPESVVSVRMSEKGVTVQVADRQHWYLVLRLLTDTQVDQVDEQGHTLLRLAFEASAMEMVKLNLNNQLTTHFSYCSLFHDLILRIVSGFCFQQHPFVRFWRFMFRMWLKGFSFQAHLALSDKRTIFDSGSLPHCRFDDDKEDANDDELF